MGIYVHDLVKCMGLRGNRAHRSITAVYHWDKDGMIARAHMAPLVRVEVPSKVNGSHLLSNSAAPKQVILTDSNYLHFSSIR